MNNRKNLDWTIWSIMNWIRKSLFLLVGLSLSTFLCIVLIELVFGGWLSNDPWKKAEALNIIRNRQITYATESIYGKSLPSVLYTRDRNGLRGECSKVSDIDILTIGGSTTDQRYVPDGMTFQDVLQRRLSAKLGEPVCISNAGVDGHSTFGHQASFDDWFPLIRDLKPKYIVFYIGINDAGFVDKPIGGFDTRRIEGEKLFWGEIREKSSIYRLLRIFRNMARSSSSGAYAQHGETPAAEKDYVAQSTTAGVEILIKKNTDGFRLRFDKLLAETKNYGAIPICVSQPNLFTSVVNGTSKGTSNVFEYKGTTYNGLDFDSSLRALNDVMRSSCKTVGGFFIDINSRQFKTSNFYDNVHMGPSGAERLGTILYEEFIKMQLDMR